ncbi:MAG: 4-alpha-glucanotransferase [Bryobacteraceae bacterium]
MKFPRASGILLHPTSLPSRFGIGDLGPEAYRFVEFLQETGQKIWQVLPLGPTGYGDSPYQCFSAFAGNPLLISPEKMVERGLLESADIAAEIAPGDHVDFARVIPFKLALLRRAFANFKADDEFGDFCAMSGYWLEDYVRFMARKGEDDQAAHRFFQFEFFRQWRDLKNHCARYRIRIMGDVPIYVAGDSADVWANPELFNREYSSGVPPDYFSATGQLWGNPVYRWDRMKKTGYRWWIERFRASLAVVDIVRLDHFRGFEAYWEVPATEKTAVNGRWVTGPGAKLFEALEEALGELPIVAENLGVITPEVEALRHEFGYPGMSVLQFAFGGDAQAASFRPHNYPRELSAYTGTHDNDTTIGWWNSLDSEREREFTKAYLATDGREIHWDFIRAALASVANTAIVPLQDVLGLGNEARMNLPATTKGNWTWRFRSEALTRDVRDRLKRLTLLYDR